jgi:hypothetical protein
MVSCVVVVVCCLAWESKEEKRLEGKRRQTPKEIRTSKRGVRGNERERDRAL